MPENDTNNIAPEKLLAGDSDHPIGEQLLADRDAGSGSLFRLAPNVTLVVLVFLAAAKGVLWLQLETVDRFRFWMIIGFFVLMVWRRSSASLAYLFFMLATVVATKSFYNISFRAWESLHQIHATDIMSTLLMLGFAGACLRFLETKKYCLGVLSKFGWGRVGLGGKNSRGVRRREFPSLLGGGWWLIPVSVVSAIMLLEFFPFDPTAVQKYWVKPRPMRLIFLIGVLFLVWFLARSLFMLIMRWKMDVDQAGVHTRSIIARQFWREHRAIESRRAKSILKNRR